jgi:hypothetical protein
MLIQHIGRVTTYTRRRNRHGGVAWMKVWATYAYLHYFSSVESAAIINGWEGGVALQWEVDDGTLQLKTAHLTPAARNGLKFTKHGRYLNLALPIRSFEEDSLRRLLTDHAGNLESAMAEEIIITTIKIIVTVPFNFKIEQPPAG